jgi:hypothetical protein
VLSADRGGRIVTNVTLTEAGVALILLEQELRNNVAETQRWQRRVQALELEYNAACDRVTDTRRKIEAIRRSIGS